MQSKHKKSISWGAPKITVYNPFLEVQVKFNEPTSDGILKKQYEEPEDGVIPLEPGLRRWEHDFFFGERFFYPIDMYEGDEEEEPTLIDSEFQDFTSQPSSLPCNASSSTAPENNSTTINYTSDLVVKMLTQMGIAVNFQDSSPMPCEPANTHSQNNNPYFYDKIHHDDDRIFTCEELSTRSSISSDNNEQYDVHTETIGYSDFFQNWDYNYGYNSGTCDNQVFFRNQEEYVYETGFQ